jgi:hypothetical protein
MPSSGFRIELERSGGLVGRSVKATVDSASLAPDDAAGLLALLDKIDMRTPAAPPRGADRFQYDIRIERDGKEQTITAYDGSMSPELKALTERLMRFVRPA